MEYSMNGILWRGYMINSNDPILKRSDNTRTVGVTNVNTHCVYISNKLTGGFLRKVLTHEVCHSAMFSYGIDLPIETEEIICDFVASHAEDIIDTVDYLFANKSTQASTEALAF